MGASVAVSGGIGFVGIVVPHLLRLLIGPDNRYLLPASALARRLAAAAGGRRRPHHRGAGRTADRHRHRDRRRAVLPLDPAAQARRSSTCEAWHDRSTGCLGGDRRQALSLPMSISMRGRAKWPPLSAPTDPARRLSSRHCPASLPIPGASPSTAATSSAMKPVEAATLRAVLPQATTLSFPFTVREVVKLGLVGGRSGVLARRGCAAARTGAGARRPRRFCRAFLPGAFGRRAAARPAGARAVPGLGAGARRQAALSVSRRAGFQPRHQAPADHHEHRPRLRQARRRRDRHPARPQPDGHVCRPHLSSCIAAGSPPPARRRRCSATS